MSCMLQEPPPCHLRFTVLSQMFDKRSLALNNPVANFRSKFELDDFVD